jgi:outer membrane receptor protein involved in Fe transport
VVVHGVVKDAATGKPVVGASVYDQETDEVAITDEHGEFTLPPGPSGQRHLAIVDPSYQRGDAITDGAAEVSVALAPLSVTGQEIVVDVEKEHTAAGEVALHREEIMKIPGAHGDPLVGIKNLPGIANTSGFGPQQGLVIRGSNPADSRIFVDGFEVPLLYHLGGITSVIPGELIEDIVYSPGGFGVEWGKASAGIVDVISRKGAKELTGFADVSFIHAQALLQGPIGKQGNFIASVRRSYIDGVIAAVVPNTSSLSFTALPRYYDYQLRGEYELAPHWKAQGFVFGSDDDFAISSDAENPDDPAASGHFSNTTNFTRAIASVTYDTPAVFNRLAASGLTQTVGFEVGTTRWLHIGNDIGTLRDEARIDVGHGVKLVGGGQAEVNDFDVNVKLPRPPHEGDPNQPNFTDDALIDTKQSGSRSILAAWAATEYTPMSRLKATVGGRVDDFIRNHATVVQPRTQLRVKLSDQTALLGAYGLYTRPPDSQDENLQASLKPERAWQSSLGVENKLLDGLTLQTTAYYIDRSDLIVQKASRMDATTATTMSGSDTYENTGIGRSYGAEMMLQARFERFFGWVSYTFASSERRDHPMDEWRKFDEDQTNNLILLGSYKLGMAKQWQLGARFQYTTGKPYTPVTGAVFASDTNRYVPQYGAVNSLRQPDANQLDIRVDHYWTFKTWKLSGYLDVSNVYMNAPIVAESYNENYTKKTYVTGIPILPSIGVRGEF